MTIESFTSCLEEFIMEHDRLLVPGLGSFTAGLQAATISDNGFTINPPYRKLEFIYGEDLGIGENEQYDYLYSIKEKMDLEKVREELAEIISEIKREVEANSLVELPGLGKLRSLGDGHLFFVMDKDAQIYPEGFALSSVSLKNRVSGIPEVVAVPKPVEQPVAATEGHNEAEASETAEPSEPAEEAMSKEQKVADGLARKKKRMPQLKRIFPSFPKNRFFQVFSQFLLMILETKTHSITAT